MSLRKVQEDSFKGKVCDRCGVEVTRAKVRRERMGHIELAAPVSHIWYFKGNTVQNRSDAGNLPEKTGRMLYFTKYIVLNPGNTELFKKQLLTEKGIPELSGKVRR